MRPVAQTTTRRPGPAFLPEELPVLVEFGPVLPHHRPPEERAASGRAVRAAVPRRVYRDHVLSSHGPELVTILALQAGTREPDLVPVRHARMLASPYACFRGAAASMAAELARLPSTGLTVQLCGDAHLANFGVFASPERRLVFDCNDFDETLPGPFEFDVLRLATSAVLAARELGLDAPTARAHAETSVAAYAAAMAEAAELPVLELHAWHVDADAAVAELEREVGARNADVTRTAASLRRARQRTSLQAAAKLTEVVDGHRRFASDPPLLVPVRELPDLAVAPEQVLATLGILLDAYQRSLPEHLADVLRRFQPLDAARKVVGVGSVGTRCWVVLLRGRDDDDLLVLQVKEAVASVLEAHLGPSRYPRGGERVVQGQRRMQGVGDPLLGFTPGLHEGRSYYWRQLRDMKGSLDTTSLTPGGLRRYGAFCATVLAYAHARTGDSIAIAAYLGGGGRIAESMGDLAVRLADRAEEEYEALVLAARDGRLAVADGAV
jgi:uncharacterized protein (DUF2252 family)